MKIAVLISILTFSFFSLSFSQNSNYQCGDTLLIRLTCFSGKKQKTGRPLISFRESNSLVMVKKTLMIVGCSMVFTIVIAAVLFLTKNSFLDRFVHLIMEVKGTAHYEGEERGTEVWNIIIGMIIPSIFLFTLVIMVFLFRKKK